jgi:hypothetical protein
MLGAPQEMFPRKLWRGRNISYCKRRYKMRLQAPIHRDNEAEKWKYATPYIYIPSIRSQTPPLLNNDEYLMDEEHCPTSAPWVMVIPETGISIKKRELWNSMAPR